MGLTKYSVDESWVISAPNAHKQDMVACISADVVLQIIRVGAFESAAQMSILCICDLEATAFTVPLRDPGKIFRFMRKLSLFENLM